MKDVRPGCAPHIIEFSLCRSRRNGIIELNKTASGGWVWGARAFSAEKKAAETSTSLACSRQSKIVIHRHLAHAVRSLVRKEKKTKKTHALGEAVRFISLGECLARDTQFAEVLRPQTHPPTLSPTHTPHKGQIIFLKCEQTFYLHVYVCDAPALALIFRERAASLDVRVAENKQAWTSRASERARRHHLNPCLLLNYKLLTI